MHSVAIIQKYLSFCFAVDEHAARVWRTLPVACGFTVAFGHWDHVLHVAESGGTGFRKHSCSLYQLCFVFQLFDVSEARMVPYVYTIVLSTSLVFKSLYCAVYTNNAMVIPTAVTTMLAAVHKATFPFLPPPPDTAFATLLTTPARATAHVLWQLEFLKVAGMSCCQLTKDHDRRSSLFRDKIPEQSAVALLLEEVGVYAVMWIVLYRDVFRINSAYFIAIACICT